MIGANGFEIAVTDDQGRALQESQQYITVREGSHIGVLLANNSEGDVSASISINDDYLGTWLLAPGEKGVIYNPDPAIATGLFKAVRKGSADWQAGQMDQVEEESQGVVSVTFQPGVIERNRSHLLKQISSRDTGANASKESKAVREWLNNEREVYGPDWNHINQNWGSFSPDGALREESPRQGDIRYKSGESQLNNHTRGGERIAKGVSSQTHENAGVVLEGDNRQTFQSGQFMAAKVPSTTIEVSLVLEKPQIKPTKIGRPPRL